MFKLGTGSPSSWSSFRSILFCLLEVHGQVHGQVQVQGQFWLLEVSSSWSILVTGVHGQVQVHGQSMVNFGCWSSWSSSSPRSVLVTGSSWSRSSLITDSWKFSPTSVHGQVHTSRANCSWFGVSRKELSRSSNIILYYLNTVTMLFVLCHPDQV